MVHKHTDEKGSEEPEIYRNGEGNPVIFANKAQAIRKALELGGDWSVHQSPASRRFYVRKLEPEKASKRQPVESTQERVIVRATARGYSVTVDGKAITTFDNPLEPYYFASAYGAKRAGEQERDRQ